MLFYRLSYVYFPVLRSDNIVHIWSRFGALGK